MRTYNPRRRVVVTALGGALLGYLILHPYTLVVYGLYGRDESMSGTFDLHYVMDRAFSAFNTQHVQMGIPFALIGAAGGLFLGLWLNARRQRMEAELSMCATDTMKTLVVTMSHYLLNAATIISGFAWRIQKSARDDETIKHAVIIRKEAENVEAVVKSLQAAQKVESENYTKNGEAKIIDLTKEIKKRMEEQSARSMGENRPETSEAGI